MEVQGFQSSWLPKVGIWDCLALQICKDWGRSLSFPPVNPWGVLCVPCFLVLSFHLSPGCLISN